MVHQSHLMRASAPCIPLLGGSPNVHSLVDLQEESTGQRLLLPALQQWHSKHVSAAAADIDAVSCALTSCVGLMFSGLTASCKHQSGKIRTLSG